MKYKPNDIILQVKPDVGDNPGALYQIIKMFSSDHYFFKYLNTDRKGRSYSWEVGLADRCTILVKNQKLVRLFFL